MRTGIREGMGWPKVPGATWLQLVLDPAHLAPTTPALGICILWAGADWCVSWCSGAQPQRPPEETAVGRLRGGRPHTVPGAWGWHPVSQTCS